MVHGVWWVLLFIDHTRLLNSSLALTFLHVLIHLSLSFHVCSGRLADLAVSVFCQLLDLAHLIGVVTTGRTVEQKQNLVLLLALFKIKIFIIVTIHGPTRRNQIKIIYLAIFCRDFCCLVAVVLTP